MSRTNSSQTSTCVAQASASVRMAVETLYVSTDLSLAQLLEQEPLKGTGIHLRTVEAWCRKGGWVEKRRAFQARWRERAIEELGDQALRARLRQLQEIDVLENQLLAEFRSKKLKPKSMESLVAAMCKLMMASNAISDSLLGGGSSARPAASAASGAPDDEGLSPEDFRAAIDVIRESRRKKEPCKA